MNQDERSNLERERDERGTWTPSPGYVAPDVPDGVADPDERDPVFGYPPGMPPDSPGMDPEALAELTGVLGNARHVYSAARLSGFSDDQAFRFALHHYEIMIRISMEAARG